MPGPTTCPATRQTPRITRGTWRAITSSLPIPFCTLHTAPSANTCAVAAIAASVNVVFVATMPSSHGGISRGVGARLEAGGELRAAGEPQPVARDRGDVRGGDVVRPHLDVVEPGQVCREEAADRAGADDADPHAMTAAAISAQVCGAGPPIPRPPTTRSSSAHWHPAGRDARR